MKRLLLINPNTSAAMTASVEKLARSWLPEGVELAAVTASFGFPVIVTRVSYTVGAYAALEAYAAAEGPYDGVILACFGDPGLEALREMAPVPVIGFAEASIRAAQHRQEPFAIITMGAGWIAMLKERVAVARADEGFIGVFAGQGSGLDALKGEDAVLPNLERLVRQAVAAGARTIILGGAALAGFAPRLPARIGDHAVTYIDCVEAALAQALTPGELPKAWQVRQPGTRIGLASRLAERLTLPITQG